MPIYAYRCSACGHAKDVLQRMSDPLLSTCPACGEQTFVKQVTAAGFQLKGSGWYATDFKGSGAAPAAPPAGGEGGADRGTDGGAAKPADGDKPAVAADKAASAAAPAAGNTASTAAASASAPAPQKAASSP